MDGFGQKLAINKFDNQLIKCLCRLKALNNPIIWSSKNLMISYQWRSGMQKKGQGCHLWALMLYDEELLVNTWEYCVFWTNKLKKQPKMPTLPFMCNVKLYGDGVPKIKGLGCVGNNQVPSYNLRMFFTPKHLPIIKHKIKKLP